MSGALRRVKVKTRAKAYNVEAEAVWVGADLLVYIWGGEEPHIGAVAAAQPRPSLGNPDATSATASVLSYLGHKEDVLVKRAAESLASALRTNVVVTAGIHWDNLDEPGLNTVRSNSLRLIDSLIQKLKQ
jgi:hypothetical protein